MPQERLVDERHPDVPHKGAFGLPVERWAVGYLTPMFFDLIFCYCPYYVYKVRNEIREHC